MWKFINAIWMSISGVAKSPFSLVIAHVGVEGSFVGNGGGVCFRWYYILVLRAKISVRCE